MPYILPGRCQSYPQSKGQHTVHDIHLFSLPLFFILFIIYASKIDPQTAFSFTFAVAFCEDSSCQLGFAAGRRPRRSIPYQKPEAGEANQKEEWRKTLHDIIVNVKSQFGFNTTYDILDIGCPGYIYYDREPSPSPSVEYSEYSTSNCSEDLPESCTRRVSRSR
ncbi:hypothetical protein JAAARDRAFT_643913 [Jaapia argillacea MUCL 33604]|uniref:Uncharacterized protein n=1 Tax=Jaapia argillacea MUCL 33604 TaxID=933084 RepID=A0A067P417_9AGAM|nr:hypothetical protein JAAARDRAFT_643913 [Jaapia argillacea MUCL 33604]